MVGRHRPVHPHPLPRSLHQRKEHAPGYPLADVVWFDVVRAKPGGTAPLIAPLAMWTAVVSGVVGTTFPPLTPPAFRVARSFTAVRFRLALDLAFFMAPPRVRSSLPGLGSSTWSLLA